MKDDNEIKTKRLRLNMENFYLRVNCPLFGGQFIASPFR